MNDMEELKKILLDLFQVCKNNSVNLFCDKSTPPFETCDFQIKNYILEFIAINKDGIAIDYLINDKERTLNYSNEHNIWI